jgi:two-component system sensor histidine kinase LytS
MDFPDTSLLLHWFDETVQILQRLFIVVVAAFIAIRLPSLRQALHGADLKWRYRPVAIIVFGLLAIIGTHSGLLIDIEQGIWHVDLTREVPMALQQNQAVVGFRDTMALVAGLIGGPWVGLGAGALAGAERYQLGGLAALAGGLGTALLGLYAGVIRYFQPGWVATVRGVFWVAITGTLLHRLMIIVFVQPLDIALALSLEVLVPVSIVNCLGCVLFFWIMRDLDRDRLEREAQEAQLLVVQAELRALRAQVYPHFLNNTLNDLNALIRLDPDKARYYVRELADFFKYTRQFADQNTITLADELAQLQRFLELQRLGLGEKLQASFTVAEELYAVQVLPGCLLTLVENALKHGFKGRPAPYLLQITAQADGNGLLLCVADNGRGIGADYLHKLGKQAVESVNKGGGVALHQLQQSLRLMFGESASLSFASVAGQGTQVKIWQARRSVN